MEEAIKSLINALVQKADASTIVLAFVIVVQAFLLVKALGRIDALSTDLAKNSQTLAKLTELLRHLLYGRKK
jgi:hypothetical protein